MDRPGREIGPGRRGPTPAAAEQPAKNGPIAGVTSTGSAIWAADRGPVVAGVEVGGPGRHAWDRFVPWWNCAFAVTLLATAAFAVAEVESTGRLAAVLGLYAALAVLYVLTVARSAGSSSGGGSERARFMYLTGAFAIFTAACFLFAGSALLLFMLIPHCFMLLRLRPALVAVTGLALINAGAELAHNGISTATVASVAIGGVFTLALALLLGSFIDRIIDQSRKRAVLIDELELHLHPRWQDRVPSNWGRGANRSRMQA